MPQTMYSKSPPNPLLSNCLTTTCQRINAIIIKCIVLLHHLRAIRVQRTTVALQRGRFSCQDHYYQLSFSCSAVLLIKQP
jgi:hypothetical protein